MTNQLPYSTDLPYTVHIDLNSCFAIIEQQANRLLRGRPVGVAAYDTPRGFVLAASYEAKAKGIRLGVNVEQARSMCPGIAIMTPDPAKYREAHKAFKLLLLEYTPDVTPKSIDEFMLEFTSSRTLKLRKQQLADISPQLTTRQVHNQAMLELGQELKDKIAERLGEWVTVNVGISTNRFLAKYAAGFNKPDGMNLIDCSTLEGYYTCGKPAVCTDTTDQQVVRNFSSAAGSIRYIQPDAALGSSQCTQCGGMGLMDLPGINTRYRARLRAAGIYTPMDFLRADLRTLKKQVFKSINGYHWYMRLRGYEVGADTIEFDRKSIGHQYALPHKTTDLAKLERLLMKLCEKTGRRLRKNQLCAQGIHLYLGFDRYVDAFDPRMEQTVEESAGFNLHMFSRWSHGEKLAHRVYSTQDIYAAAKRLLHMAVIPNNVKIMSVHVFNLQPWDPEQLSLFGVQDSQIDGSKRAIKTIEENIRAVEADKRLSDSVDSINNRYGEFVVTPAVMLDMQGTILDRVAFGQVKDI